MDCFPFFNARVSSGGFFFWILISLNVYEQLNKVSVLALPAEASISVHSSCQDPDIKVTFFSALLVDCQTSQRAGCSSKWSETNRREHQHQHQQSGAQLVFSSHEIEARSKSQQEKKTPSHPLCEFSQSHCSFLLSKQACVCSEQQTG